MASIKQIAFDDIAGEILLNGVKFSIFVPIGHVISHK